MAYVPGFTHDVFISYGHIDDQAPTKDWVRALHAYVLGKLRQICRKDVTVWRDPRMDGGDYISDTVRDVASTSAVFLSVLSPGYAQSEWCAREAEWFVQAAAADGALPGKSRLIRAVKTPLLDVPWPKHLDDQTLHYRFYDIDDQSGLVHEYSANVGDLAFEGVCSAMTQAIGGLLRRMRKQAQDRQPAAARQRSIFVADVTREVREYRDSVVAELEDRGFTVCQPEVRLDLGIGPAMVALSSRVASCDVAVHLVGRSYGTIPEGTEESLIALQLELVRKAALRQVVWQPDGLGEPEPRMQELLRRHLTPETQGSSGAFDFITGPLTVFRDALLEIVTQSGGDPDQSVAMRSVFLLCNRRDLTDPELLSMRDWLVDKGFSTDLPVYQGGETDLQQVEEESIIEADTTLIYYGTAEDLWVRQKRRAIQRAWAKLALDARRTRAIYLARPEDDLKQAHYRTIPQGLLRELDRFTPLVILGDCGPFDPNKLRPVLPPFTPDPRKETT
jgi:hypothetical protein